MENNDPVGEKAQAQRPPETAPPRAPTRTPLVRHVIRGVLIVAAIIGLAFGIRYWIFVRTHASTDDAYVTSDVVQISPQVSGTVTDVRVEDNELMHKGDLLVTLDDSTYRANVAQARANLNTAIAQAQGAGVNISLTQQTSSAQVTQAQGGLGQAQSGIGAARAAVDQARAGVQSAIANQRRSQASVSSAAADVENAKANLASARADLVGAQAKSANADREAHRQETLAAEGAGSQQAADQAETAATAARAALDAARQVVQADQASVAAKQADLNMAREQASASTSAIAQAKAQLQSAETGVGQAIAKAQQASGQLSQAQTAPTQVAISQNAKQQALARVQQNRAALQYAELQLSYTRIYAPVTGRVSKKSVEVGELLQPGTPLMALIPPEDAWVVANFKETQMHGIVRGRHAEVHVDAVSGHAFTGHVDSIAAGTGATFALLPPENATGNFVKVVQRIPVKIVFDHNQPDLDRLSTGMSVTAIVDTK